MAILIDKAKERFQNALFGTPTVNYGAENQAYLDELAKQPEFQNLAQRNNLTLDEALAGVMQGRNYSDKNIAQRQQELGINTPKNQEEVALADRGLLNNYTTRQGGLINDFVSGYEENRNNRFNTNNLVPNADKGFATRIGEGLGTLARFQNTPLGKGVLAGGLTLALGGGIAPALALGTLANVGRKHSETADTVYRNQLKQLGMSDDEVNNIGGLVTKDIFEGVTSGMRLGNQRMTFGQLAQFDEEVAQMVANNPTLANQFIPINYARDVYGRKRDLATTKMEDIKTRSEQNQEKINQGWARIKYLSEKENLNQAEKEEYLRLRNELLKVKIANEGTPRPTKPEKSTTLEPTKKVDYKNKYGLE